MVNASAPGRILFVITKAHFGGAQRYVYELALAARTAGFEVAVATGGEGALITYLQEADIEIFPLSNMQRDISLRKELGATKELWRVYRKFTPDVVHLNSSKAGALGALMARLAGVPQIVFTAHGWPFLEARSALWRAFVWAASSLTCLCAHTIIVVSKNDERHNPAFARGKSVVIPTGVPVFYTLPREKARTTIAAQAGISPQETSLWLVTTAELTPNKNLASAIRAVAAHHAVHPYTLRYLIIGAGELEAELTALIAKLNAQDYIHLLGYVPEARTYLRAFDAFMLPSKKEGMPYALLEAGTVGLPVIVSRVGGIPEVVVHEENGLLIDPHEPATFTAALRALTNDAATRQRLGTAIAQTIKNEYSLTAMLERTLTCYGTSSRT